MKLKYILTSLKLLGVLSLMHALHSASRYQAVADIGVITPPLLPF